MKAKIIGAKESLQRNNEVIKQSTDSLADDTPTKAFRLAYEKAYKKSDKQKEYKKKYEADIKDYRDRRKAYIKSREDKTPMYQEAITKLQDGLKVYEDDFKSIDAQLKEFEAKHYDDKGNIITAFDV
jgi:septal ring factor EnvC (AmiA/AmiB activator)